MQSYNMKSLLAILICSLIALNSFVSSAQTDLDEMTKDELLVSLDLGKYADLIKKFQHLLNLELMVHLGDYQKGLWEKSGMAQELNIILMLGKIVMMY